MIIKCNRVSGLTFECLLPANTYCCIALIITCGRIPGFVSGNIKNVAGLAQSELKMLLLVLLLTANFKKVDEIKII